MNWEAIRSDFPQLKSLMNNRRLSYLDNAATTLKPQIVIDTLTQHFSESVANIHRGVHKLSMQATHSYEQVRTIVSDFINAKSSDEIIFTSGTTMGINLLSLGLGQQLIKADDEIILTAMEHHSNLVPWQMLAEQTGCRLKFIPFSAKGELDLEAFESLLTSKTKILSIVHISNSLGTVNPIATMINMAKKYNVLTIIDAAQSIAHEKIDVQALDCDFLVFSGHKIFGPTGVGVLYGKMDALRQLPPVVGGGSMINKVTLTKTTYADIPQRFEAGTPPIAEVIALGAALKYVKSVGIDKISAREYELLNYAETKFHKMDAVHIIGQASRKAAIVSFVFDDVHPHDVGTILDSHGVAIRAGHHCTQPVMDFYGIPATTRMSLAFYNNESDIDQLCEGLERVKEIFA